MAGVIACVVVAFSRNYLGVHTPQDVLVAALVGIAGLWVADRTLAWVDAKPARDVVVLLAGLVVGLAFVLYITLKSYPTDYVNGELLVDPAKMTASGYQVFGVYSGCLLGWFAERRLVNFDVRADRRERTLRVVASVVFAGVGYLVLGALGGALVGEAGRKFAGVFAAMSEDEDLRVLERIEVHPCGARDARAIGPVFAMRNLGAHLLVALGFSQEVADLLELLDGLVDTCHVGELDLWSLLLGGKGLRLAKLHDNHSFCLVGVSDCLRPLLQLLVFPLVGFLYTVTKIF